MSRSRMVFGAVALVVVTASITSQVVSQDSKKAPAAPPEMSPDMMKMIEYGTPGENHKLLNPKVGTWTGTVKMWMDPAQAEPMTSTCTSSYEWMFDGRFLANTTEGDFGGQTFLGHSAEGYDNIKKKFVWVWLDNMGTGFMTAEGTYDAATKTFKYVTDGPDPVAGKYVKGRSTEIWTDNDHFAGQMYCKDSKTGKEYKCMEISYVRQK